MIKKKKHKHVDTTKTPDSELKHITETIVKNTKISICCL